MGSHNSFTGFLILCLREPMNDKEPRGRRLEGDWEAAEERQLSGILWWAFCKTRGRRESGMCGRWGKSLPTLASPSRRDKNWLCLMCCLISPGNISALALSHLSAGHLGMWQKLTGMFVCTLGLEIKLSTTTPNPLPQVQYLLLHILNFYILLSIWCTGWLKGYT